MSEIDTIYDVLFFWNYDKDPCKYKQYCSETINNIMGLNEQLAVKLVFEAFERNKVLLLSTMNIDKAVSLRDDLLALDMDCRIRPDK